MKQKFKVGDLVYCPLIGTKIFKLGIKECSIYPLTIRHNGIYARLTEDGLDNAISALPSIFHATPENHELLTKLYGVEFEAPPKRKTPKEVIQAMLDSGYHGVLCQIAMVDEDDDNIVHCYRYDYALEALDDKIIFSNHAMYNDQLNLVSPFHQKSGMEIVDFVNDKIVLQNGKVVS